jgi:tripartite-type tricarboxylate transporter receptor subunit TctC
MRFLARAFWPASLLVMAAMPSQAQPYPSQPIRVIVPFPAGGVLDSLFRSVTERMRVKLGQPVLIENKAGASGSIGLEACARSTPDGYTFCAATIEHMIMTPHLEPELWARYKSIIPVTQLVRSRGVIFAHPGTGFADIDGLVRKARAEPGKLNYGTFGWGSAPHLFLEWFNKKYGVEIANIPYKSSNEIMTELIAGRLDMSYTAIGFAKPHIDPGAARALVVSGKDRSPLLPNVPSLGELGLDFPYQGAWFALMAPEATDAAVVDKVAATIKEILNDPDYRTAFLIPQGYEAVGSTPAEFAANLRTDTLAGEALAKLVPAKPAN